jgi:cbb3-type cytochrome oxidase maturation protein
MSAIFLLIGVSLVFAFGFLAAFIWAMNDHQFEDDHTPAVRMLFDALPSRDRVAKSSPSNKSDQAALHLVPKAADGTSSTKS